MLSVLELMFSNGEEMLNELNDWFVEQHISILRPHEVQVVPAIIRDLPDKLGSQKQTRLESCDI